MNNYVMYCDGACRGNGKANALGGYGIVILNFDIKKKKELNFACRGVTNNIMELRAVIEGLKFLKEPSKVKIVTDSQYVVNAFNEKWIINWKNNNWRTKAKTPVKNKELWEELWELTRKHECEFNWVKGHGVDALNDRADKLANIAMDELA